VRIDVHTDDLNAVVGCHNGGGEADVAQPHKACSHICWMYAFSRSARLCCPEKKVVSRTISTLRKYCLFREISRASALRDYRSHKKYARQIHFRSGTKIQQKTTSPSFYFTKATYGDVILQY
jgi:hypothetical protein